MQRLGCQSVLTALLAIGVIGCKTSAPGDNASSLPENETAARAAGLSDEEIAGARRLYLAKCARCHKFYDPAQYNDKEWHSWMAKMSKKTHLTTDQEQLLSRYLETFRTNRAALGL